MAGLTERNAGVIMIADQIRRPLLILLRPRWLAFHAVLVASVAGMLWLGLWQLHRAESGNELSWAYTFEWPLFAIFAVYFWGKSVHEELGLRQDAGRADDAGSGDASETGESADAYLQRLRAEVQRPGNRRRARGNGWR
jgi:hypothetical protein